MKRTRAFLGLVGILTGVAVTAACSTKSSDKTDNPSTTTPEDGVKVKVSARPMGALNIEASLHAGRNLAKAAGINLMASPKAPDTANGEYDGMGVITSEAVVESIKIHLTTVAFGTKAPGQP